jgi:hypothetical protein
MLGQRHNQPVLSPLTVPLPPSPISRVFLFTVSGQGPARRCHAPKQPNTGLALGWQPSSPSTGVSVRASPLGPLRLGQSQCWCSRASGSWPAPSFRTVERSPSPEISICIDDKTASTGSILDFGPSQNFSHHSDQHCPSFVVPRGKKPSLSRSVQQMPPPQPTEIHPLNT